MMKHEIEDFLLLLRELQKIDAEFPLQYAVCLCEIANDEGMSLTQLAQKTGLALSTVSRIIGALSKYRQKGAPYNLVKVTISAEERRRKELSLTPKGRAVVAGIEDLMARSAKPVASKRRRSA